MAPVPRAISRAAAPREPIIFVGAIQRRKNIVRLVEAFEQLASRLEAGPGRLLRIRLRRSAAQRIERSPRKQDIQVLGYVSDPQLEELYRRASIFAFPSLDEGFGMPVLDAMARGVPVLTSNVSAMPEVAGDAALLVDPTDVDVHRGGLCRLTDDAACGTTLIQKGLARAKNLLGKKRWRKPGRSTRNCWQR